MGRTFQGRSRRLRCGLGGLLLPSRTVGTGRFPIRDDPVMKALRSDGVFFTRRFPRPSRSGPAMPRPRNLPRGSVVSAVRPAGPHASALGAVSVRSKAIVAALRPLHWSKNLLLFVPLLLDTERSATAVWLWTLVGFAAFSLCASGVYVLNDSLDVEADRQHPEKRFRAFAGGAVPVHWARSLAPLLAALGLATSWWLLPAAFTFLLLGYLLATTAYSVALKQVAFLDVIVLSGFYAVRLVAGGAAVDRTVDLPLVAAGWLFFASVAFAKRHAELARQEHASSVDRRCRGYSTADLPLVEAAGLGCAGLGVLALGRLVVEPDGRYRERLFGIGCTLLVGWLARLWWLARRRTLPDDPLVFALTDPISRLIGVVLTAVVAVSLMRSMLV